MGRGAGTAKIGCRLDLATMPQRGYVLQPKVVASATLGRGRRRMIYNRKAVACSKTDATVAVDPGILLPRVAEAATLG